MNSRKQVILGVLRTTTASTDYLAWLLGGIPHGSVRRTITSLRREGHNIQYDTLTKAYRLVVEPVKTVAAETTLATV